MTTHYEKREIMRLARSGHVRRLELLLQKGVDVNFLNGKTGMTPLMAASKAGRKEAVELLLKAGASPKLNAHDNASALHWACLYGDIEIVDLLIDAGADLNIRREVDRDDDGPAPIHMALNRSHDESHDEVAKRLIDAGVSTDIEYIGRTVLQYAQWHDCDAIVRYLRQHGVRK